MIRIYVLWSYVSWTHQRPTPRSYVARTQQDKNLGPTSPDRIDETQDPPFKDLYDLYCFLMKGLNGATSEHGFVYH